MRRICLFFVTPIVLSACDIQTGSTLRGTVVSTRADGSQATIVYDCKLAGSYSSPPVFNGKLNVTGVGSSEFSYAQKQATDRYHELDNAQYIACLEALHHGDVTGYENAKKRFDDYNLAIRRAKTLEDVDTANRGAKEAGSTDTSSRAGSTAPERETNEAPSPVPNGTQVTVYVDPARRRPAAD